MVAAVLAGVAAMAQAAPTLAPDDRFATEIAAFAQPRADHVHGPTTLFVGSSSIRLWNVAQSFPAYDTVNRGFGGATVREVLAHYEQVVAGVRPKSVIVYVGENDIAEGRSPDEVAADLLALMGRLRADMPNARIAYLSMKPTPLRRDLYPRMAAVNAIIRARADGAYDYLDIAAALLDGGGEPDAQYFGTDGLHLNPRGYALWTSIVERWLQSATPLDTPPRNAV